MKTTLIIPDQLVRELKRRAAQRGVTLSSVVADALRRGLANVPPIKKLRPLPTHHIGKPYMNLADRDALYRAMETS